MAKTEVIKNEIYEILNHVKKLDMSKLYFDYDKEADVMYVSFEKPQKSDNSELMEDGTILRYFKNKIVGLTIMNYSKRNLVSQT
ncbi:MAG: DUF2283 domain-containing protein [Spirochaetia bacterium]|nr:DUF2283 domain-containing protein [Spirochaetia bacterium]